MLSPIGILDMLYKTDMDSSVTERQIRPRGHLAPSRPGPTHRFLPFVVGILSLLAVLLICLFRWGGYILIAGDRLNDPVEAAVVLQGSIVGEKARVAGAVRLFKEGKAARLLLSVPRESYWGQPIAPVARTYIEKNYGVEAAAHTDFCEIEGADSTEQEAEALKTCIENRRWHSVAIITSDYHTRRTGIIWRRMLRREHSALSVNIHGVPDPEFHVSGLWHDRKSAKTWVLELTKLLWVLPRFTW